MDLFVRFDFEISTAAKFILMKKVIKQHTTLLPLRLQCTGYQLEKLQFWIENDELPGLDRLPKHKKKLRKLWQETGNSACKMTVNWVTRTIR
jgi:hypothetical protein